MGCFLFSDPSLLEQKKRLRIKNLSSSTKRESRIHSNRRPGTVAGFRQQLSAGADIPADRHFGNGHVGRSDLSVNPNLRQFECESRASHLAILRSPYGAEAAMPVASVKKSLALLPSRKPKLMLLTSIVLLVLFETTIVSLAIDGWPVDGLA